MKIEQVTSGNVGSGVSAKRVGQDKWDAYWWFPVPEGLTGIGFIARLAESSLVEATLALFPPGADTETTIPNEGRIQLHHFFPNRKPVKVGFHFNQSGTHIFTFRGSPHQAPGVFQRVFAELEKGNHVGEFLNLEIYELTYADNFTQDSQVFSNQLLREIEQERVRPGKPSVGSQPIPAQPVSSNSSENPLYSQSEYVQPTGNVSGAYHPSQNQPEQQYHTHVYAQYPIPLFFCLS